MKIEKLTDNCFKVTLEKESYESLDYQININNLFSILYLELENCGIKLNACKLLGYFMNKDLFFRVLQFKDSCGNNLVSDKYLFIADLPYNEVIIKFEPVKIYSLEEILK